MTFHSKIIKKMKFNNSSSIRLECSNGLEPMRVELEYWEQVSSSSSSSNNTTRSSSSTPISMSSRARVWRYSGSTHSITTLIEGTRKRVLISNVAFPKGGGEEKRRGKRRKGWQVARIVEVRRQWRWWRGMTARKEEWEGEDNF